MTEPKKWKHLKISGWKRGQPFTPAQRIETLMLRSEKMPSGCREWRGAKDRKGYGIVMMKEIRLAPIGAHRAAWMLLRGPIPDGMLVCHRCDNPCCIEIDHLFLGDLSDNAKDAVSKGRWGDRSRPGAANNLAILRDEDVIRMRALRAEGLSYVKLGRLFGVSGTQASNICRHKQWRNLP